ncbi:MAG: PD-(D/E)XK nuclease domain-containing protein, partial [Cetobacterium sp.]
KNDSKIQNDLENLFRGESIEEALKETLVFEEMEKIDTIWSLLFFTGYLTYNRKNTSSITGATTYDLIIPNQEVRTFFRDVFIAEYSDNQSSFYLKMMEDLYLGRIKDFSERFKEIYKTVISYHDKADNEKYYHHFMIGLLLTLFEKYSITSNRESGYGRYDIAMFPREKGHHGIIFEFKIAEEKGQLLKKSLEALAQIEEREYETNMIAEGTEKIIKIGIAFCGKDLEISWNK